MDETEEVSLQDTQEYIVADSGERTGARPDEDLEEPVEPGQVTEILDEPEFEEEEFDDGYVEHVSFYDDELPEDEEVEAIDLAPAEPKEPATPVSERAAAIWTVVVAKAREVKFPEWPSRERKPTGSADEGEPVEDGKSAEGRSLDIDSRTAASLAAIALACLVVGIGAYLIGKGSGDDAGAASQEGETAGKQAGAIDGASKGYPAGFVRGRDKGFEKAYIRSYKINYKRAFEQAGLDVPADEDIDVPEP